jgi:hypothetical protein
MVGYQSALRSVGFWGFLLWDDFSRGGVGGCI